jgi:hypothetical protein
MDGYTIPLDRDYLIQKWRKWDFAEMDDFAN